MTSGSNDGWLLRSWTDTKHYHVYKLHKFKYTLDDKCFSTYPTKVYDTIQKTKKLNIAKFVIFRKEKVQNKFVVIFNIYDN